MNMRKIELNHGLGRNRHKLMARILLGVGVISILTLVSAVYYVNTKLVLLQAGASQLSRQGKVADKVVDVAMRKEELAALQIAMAELALPWDSLFAALEGIKLSGVKLLAVEPDSRQGKLRITAEASETYEIVEYIQALDAQPMLQEVFLIRQERKEAGPYVFNIEAVWQAKS